MPRDRGGSRYGAAGESAAWQAVLDHYYWDRIPEAYDSAIALGAGHGAAGLVTFRMIEGEYMTRERGAIEEVSDWLSVEAISDELPPGEDVQRAIVSAIVDACNQVAWRFGYEHGAPVLVSVLSREANVPWMPGRYGYCTDKYPYDKICIPHSSVTLPDDLEHVILHEYAHVVSLNLSEGKCPLWLDEAVAMVSGGGVDRRTWSRLADGREEWLSPEELDGAYRADREDREGHRTVWLAYQQSAVLGFYLASLKGESGLGDLMRGFSNNSTIRELLTRLRGLGPSDEALREVYGFDTQELFALSKDWLEKEVLRSQGP